MEIEGQSILACAGRLDENLIRAVDVIVAHPGKVIVSGIGKSGYIARKLAATLQSTGTPAVFLHPAEATHGDLGICQPGDPAILISKSGTTAELLALIQPLRGFGAPLIGILGNPHSALAGEVDIVLDACVPRESDPGNFTPTASASVALALGHALAIALMQARQFNHEKFLHLHAGGQLGRNLSVTVREVMHVEGEVAWVEPDCPLRQVVIAMSLHPLGAACVTGQDHRLKGLVTDGDLRRALEQHDDIRQLRASDVMTHSPTTVTPEALIHDALSLMEDRPRQISVLPVVESHTHRCLGLIRLHDIYHSGAGID